MHCNLRRPSHASPFPLQLRRYTKFEVAEPIHCRIIAVLYFCYWYITLRCDIWPCDLGLWPLIVNICSVSPVTWWNSTKFERNRAIRSGVIAISVFDFMTLNIALRLALGSGIIFTKLDLRQLIRAWIMAFLMLIRYITQWSWPLTRWPWKFVVHQASRDRSLYEIWAKSSNPQVNYW